MRKRVFGSIFLTSLVTLLLTTGLLLLAVHAGLTNDMRRRLVTESSYLSAVDNIREELEKFGSVYADRLTLVAQDGTVQMCIRDREQEAAVFYGERVVRVIQKNGSLFVDFAELFLPSGGVGQVRRAGFSLHRQAVQEFCRL